MNDLPLLQQKTVWHLGQLDALRGLAILNVMLVHAVYWGPEHMLALRPALLLMIAFAGQRGVQLFFLVSAFTLYMSHVNRRDEAHPTINFFLRRFFRLTPMLYLSVVLTYFLWPQALGTARTLCSAWCTSLTFCRRPFPAVPRERGRSQRKQPST